MKLGSGPKAQLPERLKSYRRLAKAKYHPDRNQAMREAEARLTEIQRSVSEVFERRIKNGRPMTVTSALAQGGGANPLDLIPAALPDFFRESFPT